jgi:hypothetical protein
MAHFSRSATTAEASSRFSAFLFAKLLPKKQYADKMCREWQSKMASPPLEDPQYKRALTNLIIPYFRRGWDCEYAHAVKTTSLPKKSCVELEFTSDWDLSYESFVKMGLGDLRVPDAAFLDIKERELRAVPDSGKLRLITIASKWQHLLAAVHKVIYDVLTKRKFGVAKMSPVLRGEAVPSAFECFPFAEDTELVSGDYEASTDNLSSAHALHILRELRRTSTFIPGQIWDLAEASLTGWVSYTDRHGKVTRTVQATGQLMGNFLSFPLLCISNLATLFVAFGSNYAWEMIYSGLVKVNGDDIVWCARPGAYEKWIHALPRSGFVINPTKTSRHNKFFTLNSKLFKRGTVNVKKVWHLVPKGIFKPLDTSSNADFMAAHEAAVQVNLQCCPGNRQYTVGRALRCVKINAWRQTSVKNLAGRHDRAFQGFPRVWKNVERICAFELMRNPLKERFKEPLRGVRRISVTQATEEQLLAAPYVAASIAFNAEVRRTEKVTNDRFLSWREHERCLDWLYMANPDYRVGKEREEVWVRWDPETNVEPVV